MKCIRLLGIVIALFGFTVVGFAQTLQEVTEARNKGAELMSNGDVDGAIAELEKCVELSKKVGEEADEHKLVAEGALPELYLKKADAVLDTKDYPAALKAFDAAIAAAEKYNDPGVKEKAEKPIPKVYLAMGNSDYQNKNFEDAIKALDQATTRDPDMALAYYLKGACYQSLKDDAKMEENYKLAIEKGSASGDASAKNAATQLGKIFYNNGINAMKVKKWDDAITAFTKVTEVDNPLTPDAYYRLTSCYTSKSSWDNAITNGEKALELKAGADSKATDPIYYELGTAYAGKKDNGKACECFKKVANEPYLKGAKYQIEVALKCK